MGRRRRMATLAFVATTLATAVFLAEVASAYRKSAIVSALVGVFCLGAVMAASDDRPVTATVIAGIVATGFVGAVYWDSLDRYRLPPTRPETYLVVPLVVLAIGLFGYGIGRLLRQRTSLLAVFGPGTD